MKLGFISFGVSEQEYRDVTSYDKTLAIAKEVVGEPEDTKKKLYQSTLPVCASWYEKPGFKYWKDEETGYVYSDRPCPELPPELWFEIIKKVMIDFGKAYPWNRQETVLLRLARTTKAFRLVLRPYREETYDRHFINFRGHRLYEWSFIPISLFDRTRIKLCMETNKWI